MQFASVALFFPSSIFAVRDRAIIGLIVAVLALSSWTTASAADVTVGTATAHAGQRATGFIQVPAGVDAATNIPVIIINGSKPGPKLALVAGSHGTEYA